MLLFGKISSLTSHILKASELGKITNLLSNDLTIIEIRLGNFFNAFAFPVYAIGFTILLFFRLGWPGIFGVLILTLAIPLSNFISKFNGNVIG
jgi:ABC-type multidrug transport system fused ATPase/permease subunit